MLVGYGVVWTDSKEATFGIPLHATEDPASRPSVARHGHVNEVAAILSSGSDKLIQGIH